MQPRLPLAQHEQQQLPVQVSEFWSQLGRCRRSHGQPDAARPLFQRALAIRRDTLKDHAGMVENLADLAALHADTADTDAALRGYRSALSQLHARVGPRHPLAIDLLRSLCALERSAGQMGLAERDCTRAAGLAMDLHGSQHPSTIDAQRQLAAIEVDLGHFASAAAAFGASRDWLVAHLGPQHESVARDDNSLAIIAWERGNTGEALTALDRSIAIRRRDSNQVALAGVLFNKAMVLHDAGRDREARPLLVEARDLRSRNLGPSHELVGDTDRLLGEVDAALGNPQRALARLQTALQFTRKGYGPSHSHTRRAELSLAVFQADQGDSSAVARLDRLAALPQDDPELRKVAWLASAEVASLRCHGQARAQALASFQVVIEAMAQSHPEGGAVTRHVERLRDACS